MKKIDMDSWKGKEYFDFFSFSDIPQFSVTYNIDVTNFLKFVKEKNISFYCSMVYAVVKAMEDTTPFCYRIHSDGVYLCDEILPSFTYMVKGDDRFKMVTLPVSGSMEEYAVKAKQISTEQENYLPKTYNEETDNYVYITSLPWITYTNCDMESVIDKNDAIPRVCFGKYFKNFDGKILMPLTLRVNHRVVNGYDISLFNQNLDKYLLNA